MSRIKIISWLKFNLRQKGFYHAPAIDRVSKKTTILLSRRLTTSDGLFGGVILASLNVLGLQSFFNTINVGQNGIYPSWDLMGLSVRVAGIALI